ncbi:uncharacterized protein [Littorina saxatilis]|uniref:uncharacterized protein n=1 Tax=Littorina saxatilis TaxID=31220 RepID=UPI0038B4C347
MAAADIDNFIRDQKAKLATERKALKQAVHDSRPAPEAYRRQWDRDAGKEATLAVEEVSRPRTQEAGLPLTNRGSAQKRVELGDQRRQEYIQYLREKEGRDGGRLERRPVTPVHLPVGDYHKNRKAELGEERQREYQDYIRQKEGRQHVGGDGGGGAARGRGGGGGGGGQQHDYQQASVQLAQQRRHDYNDMLAAKEREPRAAGGATNEIDNPSIIPFNRADEDKKRKQLMEEQRHRDYQEMKAKLDQQHQKGRREGSDSGHIALDIGQYEKSKQKGREQQEYREMLEQQLAEKNMQLQQYGASEPDARGSKPRGNPLVGGLSTRDDDVPQLNLATPPPRQKPREVHRARGTEDHVKSILRNSGDDYKDLRCKYHSEKRKGDKENTSPRKKVDKLNLEAVAARGEQKQDWIEYDEMWEKIHQQPSPRTHGHPEHTVDHGVGDSGRHFQGDLDGHHTYPKRKPVPTLDLRTNLMRAEKKLDESEYKDIWKEMHPGQRAAMHQSAGKKGRKLWEIPDTAAAEQPLQLGEYESTQQKLQRERQEDYNKFLQSQNQGSRAWREIEPSAEKLLPVGENEGKKRQMEAERNREYNEFLKSKHGVKRTGQEPAGETLPLGGYEQKRRAVEEERKREYQEYLKQAERTGVSSHNKPSKEELSLPLPVGGQDTQRRPLDTHGRQDLQKHLYQTQTSGKPCYKPELTSQVLPLEGYTEKRKIFDIQRKYDYRDYMNRMNTARPHLHQPYFHEQPLPLGGYEHTKRLLNEQRKQDYKDHLKEKETARTQWHEPRSVEVPLSSRMGGYEEARKALDVQRKQEYQAHVGEKQTGRTQWHDQEYHEVPISSRLGGYEEARKALNAQRRQEYNNHMGDTQTAHWYQPEHVEVPISCRLGGYEEARKALNAQRRQEYNNHMGDKQTVHWYQPEHVEVPISCRLGGYEEARKALNAQRKQEYQNQLTDSQTGRTIWYDPEVAEVPLAWKLGGYEEARKALNTQRQQEYNSYLHDGDTAHTIWWHEPESLEIPLSWRLGGYDEARKALNAQSRQDYNNSLGENLSARPYRYGPAYPELPLSSRLGGYETARQSYDSQRRQETKDFLEQQKTVRRSFHQAPESELTFPWTLGRDDHTRKARDYNTAPNTYSYYPHYSSPLRYNNYQPADVYPWGLGRYDRPRFNWLDYKRVLPDTSHLLPFQETYWPRISYTQTFLAPTRTALAPLSPLLLDTPSPLSVSSLNLPSQRSTVRPLAPLSLSTRSFTQHIGTPRTASLDPLTPLSFPPRRFHAPSKTARLSSLDPLPELFPLELTWRRHRHDMRLRRNRLTQSYGGRPSLIHQTDEFKASNVNFPGMNDSDASKVCKKDCNGSSTSGAPVCPAAEAAYCRERDKYFVDIKPYSLDKVRERNDEYNRFLREKDDGRRPRNGDGPADDYATLPGLRYSSSAKARQKEKQRNLEYNQYLASKRLPAARGDDGAIVLGGPRKGWGTPTYEDMLEQKRREEQQYRKRNDPGYDYPLESERKLEELDKELEKKKTRFRNERLSQGVLEDPDWLTPRRGRGPNDEQYDNLMSRMQDHNQNQKYTMLSQRPLPSVYDPSSSPWVNRVSANNTPRFASSRRAAVAGDSSYYATLPIGKDGQKGRVILGQQTQNEKQRQKEQYRDDLQKQMQEAAEGRRRERRSNMDDNPTGNGFGIGEKQLDMQVDYSGFGDSEESNVQRRAQASKPRQPHVQAYREKIIGSLEKLDDISPRSELILGRRRQKDQKFGGYGVGGSILDQPMNLNSQGPGRGLLGTGFESLLEAPRVSTLGPPAGLEYAPASYVTGAGSLGQSSVDEAYNFYATRNPLEEVAVGGGGGGGGGGGRGGGRVPNLILGRHGGAEQELGGYGGGGGGGGPGARRVNHREGGAYVGYVWGQPVSGMADFPTDDDKRLEQQRKAQAYQAELARQIEEKKMKKAKDRDEKERYDIKLEREAQDYNPYGRGGGGAPMRDDHGNILANLRTMRNDNENLDSPRKTVTFRSPRAAPGEVRDDLFGPPPVQTTAEGEQTFARGGHGIFGMPKTETEKSQSEKYKSDLKRQIEERKMEEMKRKEEERREEEREQRKVDEQQQRMQAEYEEEKKKVKEKEDEARRKNEELIRLAEERKKEAEDRRRATDDARREDERREKDAEINARLANERGKSPVIPALRKKEEGNERGKSPVIPALREKEEGVQEGGARRGSSPPVPAARRHRDLNLDDEPSTSNHEPAPVPRAGSADVLNQLAAMRQQLQNERQRVETMLKNEKNDPDVFDPRLVQRPPPAPVVRPEIDVFETALQGNAVQVRRTPGDRPNPMAMDEFTSLKHKGNTDSRKEFLRLFPEQPGSSDTLEAQQAALLLQQEQNLRSLREQREYDTGYPKAPVPPRSAHTRTPQQLHSDSAFVDVESINYFPDDFDDIPGVSRNRNESARSRRRARQDPSPRIPAARRDSSPRLTSRRTNADPFGSTTSLNIDRLSKKNEDRLKKLRELQGDDMSLYDPDDVLDRFMSKQSHKRDYIREIDSSQAFTSFRANASR